MRRFTSTLAVLGAVTILVLAGNTIALATTGHNFILGLNNSANNVTTLTRTTAGSALGILTKSTSNAPMQVNGHGKVVNLNADMVDGLDSTVLRNHSYVYTKTITSPVTSFTFTVPVPVGSYEFSYSALLWGGENTNDACQIMRGHNSAFSYLTTMVDAGANSPGLSAAGVVTKAAGDTIQFLCWSGNAFTTLSAMPIQLVMTPTVATNSTF